VPLPLYGTIFGTSLILATVFTQVLHLTSSDPPWSTSPIELKFVRTINLKYDDETTKKYEKQRRSMYFFSAHSVAGLIRCLNLHFVPPIDRPFAGYRSPFDQTRPDQTRPDQPSGSVEYGSVEDGSSTTGLIGRRCGSQSVVRPATLCNESNGGRWQSTSNGRPASFVSTRP
jgi:hypothetical protein